VAFCLKAACTQGAGKHQEQAHDGSEKVEFVKKHRDPFFE
jgi:hypothetical protein